MRTPNKFMDGVKGLAFLVSIIIFFMYALPWAVDYCFKEYSLYVWGAVFIAIFFGENRRLRSFLNGVKIEVVKAKVGVRHLVAVSLVACVIGLACWYRPPEPQDCFVIWSGLTCITLMKENVKLINRLKELGRDYRTGKPIPPVISQWCGEEEPNQPSTPTRAA